MDNSTAIRCIASLGVGVAVSTGHPVGIAAAIVMPPLAMGQQTHLGTYESAFCYYAGASWPVIPAVRNFFGPSASVFEGIIAWLTAAALLAAVWPLAWTKRQNQLVWRVPLVLLATVVPPLGLIGWASPITAAGLLFPGTAWFGLFAVVLLCAGLCIKAWTSYTALVAVILGIFAHLNYPDPLPPFGWESLNTHFGAIAHGPTDLIREYTVAQSIQNRARSSRARVLVFPEMVVPRWTAATDLFWQQTLARLSASGKTILVGAGLPDTSQLHKSSPSLASYDFGAAAAALRGARLPIRIHIEDTDSGDSDPYRNAIVIRGKQTAIFAQRVPVPFGMWHPFGVGGVPLNISGPGVIGIANQRAAILICYEQLLTWPVLVSMLDHPTILLAVANDYWVERTAIPRYQATVARAWGRLFGIPVISAVNR
ncbi:MAG: hypothetical protein ACR2JB_30110 [Bryobacteraceae bacterium]